MIKSLYFLVNEVGTMLFEIEINAEDEMKFYSTVANFTDEDIKELCFGHEAKIISKSEYNKHRKKALKDYKNVVIS